MADLDEQHAPDAAADTLTQAEKDLNSAPPTPTQSSDNLASPQSSFGDHGLENGDTETPQPESALGNSDNSSRAEVLGENIESEDPGKANDSPVIQNSTKDVSPNHESSPANEKALENAASSLAGAREALQVSTGEGGAEEHTNTAINNRIRSDSRSTVTTQSGHKTTPISSSVFVVTALDAIVASKEARRSKELENATKDALANIKQSEQQPIDPETIFHPLLLATKTASIPLQVTALDCIGKLITYSYFAFPSVSANNSTQPNDRPPLIERAIETICDCFENESTPIEIQQQIIKSLLAAVLNDKIIVHGAGLLKAVRQIYNIFIYSKSSQNQLIAQGSLTQMISTVYDRVRMRLDLKEARMRDFENRDSSSPDTASERVDDNTLNENDGPLDPETPIVTDQPVAKEPTEKLTLQSFEANKDDAITDSAPTMVTRAKAGRKSSRIGDDMEAVADDEDEIYVRDAFLVFRALCKLSHKILSHEQQQDLKSQNMRSKLLSLHLMQHLLNNHIAVFNSPIATIKHNANPDDGMTLLQAIKPHLCLSLSRNGASSVPRVFEVCCEIFWLMLKHMRVLLKVCYSEYRSSPQPANSLNRKNWRFSSKKYISPF